MIESMEPQKFNSIIARIDRENAADPCQKEITHSEMMWRWIGKLRPDASSELRIAARGQHICRWTIPRATYEDSRIGYLKWRQALKVFHAEKVAGIMTQEGASPSEIDRVTLLIGKKNLRDSETQALEDALCLIFLETGIKDLLQKTGPEKFKTIVIKTWKKMSDQGHEMALGLPFDDADRACILEALAE